MNIKNGPKSGDTLLRASNRPSQVDDLSTEKLRKYARLKGVNCQIGAILGQHIGDRALQDKLLSCGRFLAFRKYIFSGELKLTSGNFCNMHMLCPCCAAARSRRLLARWLPIIFDQRKQQHIRHYLLTLTWPPPPAPLAVAEGPEGDKYKLRQNLAVGVKAWGKLWQRKKRRGTGPLTAVLGAILSTEVTLGSAGWHPHFHILVTMPKNKRISAADLRQEWSFLTGGRQLRLDPLVNDSDVVEVFKYAVKPVDLDNKGQTDPAGVLVRYKIWKALKGSRFIRGYGSYYNVKEEDLTDPETVEDLGEWIDLIFRWIGFEYQLYKELKKPTEGQTR